MGGKHTTQIRPSVNVETLITIEKIMADMKIKSLGQALEVLLEESDTYKKSKQEVQNFIGGS